MGLITVPTLIDGAYADVTTLETSLQTIENEINGLLSDVNISATANIAADKIGDGGAVTQNETTSVGAPVKIPRLSVDGDLVLNGKLIFMEGLI